MTEEAHQQLRKIRLLYVQLMTLNKKSAVMIDETIQAVESRFVFIAIIFAVKEISTLTNLRGPWSCEYKNQALAAHMAIWQSRPFWFEINRNLNILSHIFSVVFTFHPKTGEQNESAA